MQQLIQFLLDRLLMLWPIARVGEWQLAMLVRGGHIVRELAPGLCWRIPLLDQVMTYPATEISIDLDAATVETADGIAYTVSANISYRMVSMARNWRTVWNLDVSLGRVALGRLASFVSTVQSADLSSGRARIEAQLLADLAGELAVWGIVVTRMHLTDCVRGRVSRLYHNGITYKAAS